MPPYPIARIPKRGQHKYLSCLRCETKLEHRPDPYQFMMFCPTCDCLCFFRAEDVYFNNDGLVVPCEKHWDEECEWRNT